MTTIYSSFIWDHVQYLWYLQFPWRFLTFGSFYLAAVIAYAYVFINAWKNQIAKLFGKLIFWLLILITLITYTKYFRPQYYLKVSDQDLTTKRQIMWEVSRSSFEFVPKGVATKKTALNTTTLAINEKELPSSSYQILTGQVTVSVLSDKFREKRFLVNSQNDSQFQLNTYNFPGWYAYLDNQPIKINDQNRLKLITVIIPPGEHQLIFKYQNTVTQNLSEVISVLGLLMAGVIFLKYQRD